MTSDRPRTFVRAWRSAVPGIAEVFFHAHFTRHAYPAHTHDTWDLMILDDGSVDFALDRHRHGATGSASVLLLPPGIPHDGRTVTESGFRKRNLYLDESVLPQHLAGRAADAPVLDDALLRGRIDQLHIALVHPGDGFEAESRLMFRERLHFHLAALQPRAPGREANRLAAQLRDLLDSRTRAGLSLHEAANTLYADPTHLIRCFKRTYGLPPHAYLTGKRIEHARRLLLDGHRPAEVATTVGLHDPPQPTLHTPRRHHPRALPADSQRFVPDRLLRPPYRVIAAGRPALSRILRWSR